MIPIRIRSLGFSIVLLGLACSSPRSDASSARDSASERESPDSVRVVIGDTTRLPNGRLRIKVTEDVPGRHRKAP
jgi:hypothetical protein